jgi:hypothetical protein
MVQICRYVTRKPERSYDEFQGPREELGQAAQVTRDYYSRVAADKSLVIHGAALQLLDIVDRTFLNNATSFRAYWILLLIGK